ncbi:MAG: TRAP transporter substrate-binding protein [Firmicutes bacterium]|nr:TRAP transporter substrate-binding protein [Bacillota bacterium]
MKSSRFGKKKIIPTIFAASLVILLLSAAALGGCTTGETPGPGADGDGAKTFEPVNLSYAHFFPDVHIMSKEIVDAWAEEIEKATDGRVTVTNYPGETLLKADKTYEGVIEGVADIGLSFFSYNRGRFPLMEAVEMPGIPYNNATAAAAAGFDFARMMEPEELKDTKLLMVGTSGPIHAITKGKQVVTLEDMKGLELQTTGISALAAEALGAIPVAMPMSETYEALSRGVITGYLGPVEALEGFRLADEIDYATICKFIYSGLYYITMNKDKFESLPDEIQDIIVETSDKFQKDAVAGIFDVMNKQAYEYSLDKGIEFSMLSDEEAERWIEQLIPIQEDYVNTDDGLPRKEALELAKELAEKYNKEFPPTPY